MEVEGYHFPLLSFDVDPDEDWLRFRRWMAGRVIRGKLKSRLPFNFIIKETDQPTDEQIIPELERLQLELERLHCSLDLRKEIPPRLLYENLLEFLEEECDFMMLGCWHLDGCSGYCPDCFQRPWCETGGTSCWQEDEEAGCMVFPENVKKYVSPSPVSLEILRSFHDQDQEDLDHNECF
jgi:hypothetical protein